MKLTDDVVLEATREYINHSTAYSPQYNPISAMRSALAVAVKMMSEWQSIETAPRDGTVILGYYPCGAITVIYCRHYIGWDKVERSYFSFEKDAHARCSSVVVFPDASEPTHWMPLPTPPKEI